MVVMRFVRQADCKVRVMPPRQRSLAPKEHGAYAQLGLPVATALVGGRPTASAVALTAAAVAVFCMHEPLLVVLGRRGARARVTDGTRAWRWLAVSAVAALGSAIIALPLSPVAVAIPGLLGVVVALLIAYDLERTTWAETIVAWCLSSVSVPIAVASGWTLRNALGAAIAWAIGLSAATVAVRGILAAKKKGVPPARTAALVVVLPALAGALAAAGAIPAWPVLASLPVVAVASFIALRPPHPRSLHAVGWSLVTATVMTGAAIVLSVR